MAKWRRGGGGSRRRWVIEFVPQSCEGRGARGEEEAPVAVEGDAGAPVEVGAPDVVESGCMADVPVVIAAGVEGHPPCVSGQTHEQSAAKRN